MEKDNELKGEGNSYDFGARIYDSRVGRWMSIDPLAAKYTSFSPYVGMGNNPIILVDKDGEDITVFYQYVEQGKTINKPILTITTEIKGSSTIVESSLPLPDLLKSQLRQAETQVISGKLLDEALKTREGDAIMFSTGGSAIAVGGFSASVDLIVPRKGDYKGDVLSYFTWGVGNGLSIGGGVMAGGVDVRTDLEDEMKPSFFEGRSYATSAAYYIGYTRITSYENSSPDCYFGLCDDPTYVAELGGTGGKGFGASRTANTSYYLGTIKENVDIEPATPKE